MPTYDYKCNACGERLEIFQSMKDAPKRKCPKCGKNALERLIGTGAAVIFKGSGFYQTDYRSDSYKKAAEADKPAETKPDKDTKSSATEGKGSAEKSKPETKAEAKPDSKAESKPASDKPSSSAAKPKKPKAKA
jgi:putative FmdB family regulatory protein